MLHSQGDFFPEESPPNTVGFHFKLTLTWRNVRSEYLLALLLPLLGMGKCVKSAAFRFEILLVN